MSTPKDKAIEALLRELKGIRPGLDRPHDHHGVQREKVDQAIKMGESALRTDPPAEPTKPLLSYDECHTIALESVGPRDSAETVRDIYERDRAKLIETLQALRKALDEVSAFNDIRGVLNPSMTMYATFDTAQKALDRTKDIHGIEPQKD